MIVSFNLRGSMGEASFGRPILEFWGASMTYGHGGTGTGGAQIELGL